MFDLPCHCYDDDRDDPTLVLSVYARSDNTISDPPRDDVWEIPDELWKKPDHRSDFVRFDKGIIEICRPGTYNFSGTISFFVENKGENIVHGNALVRFITGKIRDRYSYDVHNVLVTKYFPTTIYPLRRPNNVSFETKITISFNTTYKLSRCDIDRGNNTFAPQYRYELFLDEGDTWPEDFILSRNTDNVETFMNIVRYK